METQNNKSNTETKTKIFNSIAENKYDETLEEFLNNNVNELKAEIPVMGSNFESQFILYCNNKNYNHAVRNLDLTKKMERSLDKYARKGTEIKTPQGELILSSKNGTHSEYRMFYLRNNK